MEMFGLQGVSLVAAVWMLWAAHRNNKEAENMVWGMFIGITILLLFEMLYIFIQRYR